VAKACRFEDLPQIIEAMAHPYSTFHGSPGWISSPPGNWSIAWPRSRLPGGHHHPQPQPSGRRTDGRCRPQQAGAHRRSQVLIQEIIWSNITAPRSCRCAGQCRRHGRRRPGHAGQYRHQGHRQEGAPPLSGRILAGFAGGTADAFTLFERFEAKLEKHQGNLVRSAVELAKDWRSDRALRRLEAMLGGRSRISLIITGNGDVLEPEQGIVAIGSGGAYAQSAARALLEKPSCRRSTSSPSRWKSPATCASTPTAISRSRRWNDAMTPQEIVSELDKHIVGQNAAKKAVAIALRNRWRRPGGRAAAPGNHPKNILMIGPTGVGKTEIARRLARLANAPFIKIEATKFTEVGYVGRDVETIIRDLVEMAIKSHRERAMKAMRARAEDAAEERVLDAAAAGAQPWFFRREFRGRRHREYDPPEIPQEAARRRTGRQGNRYRGRGAEHAGRDLRAAGHGRADPADPGHVPEYRRRQEVPQAEDQGSAEAADRRGSRQAGQ
jgi:hypothetical protein